MSMCRNRFAVSLVIAFLATILGLPCLGQEYRATITGTVTDASKAVIPKATVRVRNLDTGEVTTVQSNSAGVYAVPYLHPGQKLEVSAEAPGFKKSVYPPVVLTISQTQTADFALQIGSETQQVTVDSESYQIGLDSEKADRGYVVDNKTITQMPLNGRNPLSLLDFVPGVTNEAGTGSEGTPNNMYNVSFYTVNGTPTQNTEYTIDGMPNNSTPWYSASGPSTIPSVDSIQEFKVVTNPYDAQYGRTAGGVVSMELKSGTKDLHGSVYEFGKRGYMDANSWENNYVGQNRPAHTEDQYGFEVAGPVYIPHIYHGRDKTFFMFNFERFKEIIPNFQTYDIPNAAWLQGDFSNFVDQSGATIGVYDPSTATTNNPGRQLFQNSSGQYNHIDPSRFNPIAVNALKLMLAAAPSSTIRFPNELPWEQIWVDTIPNSSSSQNYVLKIDQILGSKDHLSGSWIRSYNPSESWNSPKSAPEWFDGSTYTEYHMNAGVDWEHTWRSNLLSDVHFSYQRYWRTDGPPPAGLNYNPAQLGYSSSLLSQLPLKGGFPIINFNMQQGTAATGNGYNTWLAMSRDFYYMPDDTYSVAPTITWVKGKHNIRGGLDFRNSHLNQTYQGDNVMSVNTDGQATSYAWNQLASGTPLTGSGGTPTLPDGTPLSTSTSGNAVLDFLIGQPTGAPNGTAGVAVQNELFPYYNTRYYAPWIQDDWKISPRLTLNLGFRYDLNGPPTVRHNWMNTGFDFNAVNPINGVVPSGYGLPTLKGGLTFPGGSGGNLPWARDYTKWQPRVGFAWLVKPGTVLRGGVGRVAMGSTDTPTSSGYSYNPVYNDSPDGNRTYFANNLGNPYPNGIPAIPGASLGLTTKLGQNITFANSKTKLPSVITGSLGLQQTMPHDGKLEISYVMSRGYGIDGLGAGGAHYGNYNGLNVNSQLYKSCSAMLTTASNPYPQGKCEALQPNPFVGVAGFSGSYETSAQLSALELAAPYPEFRTITETQNNWGKTWYNSMQTTYQQRLGWEQINGSWTWSKSMQSGGYLDQPSSDPSIGYNNIYLVPLRSIAGTDRKNRITVTSVLDIPVGRGMKYFSGMNRALDAAIGGWELAADSFWETGQPVSLNNGYNIVGNIRATGPKHSTSAIIDAGVNQCIEQWIPGSPATSTSPAVAGYYTLYTANGQTSGSCSGGVAWQQAAPYAPMTSQPYTDQIRGPGTEQIDVNLSKNFKFPKGISMQLRMEEFNVLNHPTWNAAVDMTPTDTNFGTVNKILTGGQSNSPRTGQLGVKVLW